MSVALQDAATVVLLRDGSQGLEVLMAKRSASTRFSAGAFVFPGGAVDPGDSIAPDVCVGLESDQCDARFGEAGAARFYLTAARELDEEVGLWLFDGPPGGDALLGRKLHAGALSLARVLDDCGQRLDAQVLHYFSFWTTPPMMPRRYRTRFFVGQMPHGQTPKVDAVELTELCWTTPQQMLHRQRAGEVDLIFPTVKELQRLSQYASAEQALSALREIDEVPEIRTRHRLENGRRVLILMPGEPGYEDLPAW